MKILEIAFSVDWFLTIPGMLITAGVFLLIIAFIMMLVGSKKNKKEEKIENNQTNSEVVASPVQPEAVVAPQNVDVQVATSEPLGPIPEVSTIDMSQPVVAPIEMPTISPVASAEVVEPMAMPVVEPVVDAVQPVVEVNPVEVIVPIEPVAIIDSSEEVIPTEKIESVAEVVLEQPDATNLEKTSVNIYGGNPIPTIEAIPDTPRPIYGGADPLEATQNLPKVDIHHEPYSGGQVEVVTPMPIPEIQPIPVVEASSVATPVTSIPDVNHVTPEIVEVPTAPVQNDVVVEPVVQPTQPASEVIQIPDIEQL